MNMSIACEVKECKYHHPIEKFCTLNQIKVEKDSVHNPSELGYADCASFEKA